MDDKAIDRMFVIWFSICAVLGIAMTVAIIALIIAGINWLGAQ
jgi:hypothetical protein